MSPALYSAISPATTESNFATSVKTDDGNLQEPPKKKQKRNKPTLSCEECVERKTKVSKMFSSARMSQDRGSYRLLEKEVLQSNLDTLVT
jgi:hypothetical protein